MLKKTAFYLILLGLMLCLLELFAFLTVRFLDPDDFFDSREMVLGRLNEADLAEFKLKGSDPVMGWRWHGPQTREAPNCLGEMIEYHYDAGGARLHPRFDVDSTAVVVVGDSYTNGDEVSDSDTFPARLSELLGVSVANHGVGGYDPTQSLLNLRDNISRYPSAKVTVLVIMYENVYRMLNSYRPVLYTQAEGFALKPYMANGRIVTHPGSQAFDNLSQFKQAAQKSFDEDFWAKPVAEFPYSLALGKSLASNYVYYRRLQRALSKLGQPEYFLIFNADEIRLNLIALLNQYASMAQGWGVQPVVVFVPRNQLDTASASKFIAQHRREIDPRLLIGDVAEYAAVDWTAFNYREKDSDNTCHPSPYGYRTIAAYIAELLRRNRVWPAT
jgi:hypothetical protein